MVRNTGCRAGQRLGQSLSQERAPARQVLPPSSISLLPGLMNILLGYKDRSAVLAEEVCA